MLDADPNVVDAMVQMPGANGQAGTNQGVMRSCRWRKTASSTPTKWPANCASSCPHFPGINVFVANPPAIRIGGRGGAFHLPVHHAGHWIWTS